MQNAATIFKSMQILDTAQWPAVVSVSGRILALFYLVPDSKLHNLP
jgi:hypothetical protein